MQLWCASYSYIVQVQRALHMECSRQMHPPHLTRAGAAAALLLATVVLQMQVAVVRPAPAVDVAGGGMHHLHFFMHDGYTGPSPTAVVIVNGTAEVVPGVRFGDTVVMDDVLTEGLSRASRTVGRAQGTYVTASMAEDGHPAMLLSMNVVLTDYGGYTGSTVLVMGRNDISAPVRELSVVGGTGRFRMATGYVLWKTASWRGKNAVLELDVFLRA